MASQETLLDVLQTQTQVDCDTLDTEVARRYEGIVDCTSNQAIAYGELQKPQHKQLLEESIALSSKTSQSFGGVSQDELAIEIAMVQLSLQIAPHISGIVHTQTNPRYAYDTLATVSNALRITSLYSSLSPDFDLSRVCVKIPSTFEGLQACRTLSARGIKTLATTLFTIEQAVLAADAGCHYIAPYLNALKSQTDSSYHDPTPEFDLCVSAQKYFELHHMNTKVLAASFSSIDDVMKLAGIHHVTLPPHLLEQLANLPGSAPKPESMFQSAPTNPPAVSVMFLYHQEYFQQATERGNQKLSEAIDIFCDMQSKLETLIERTRK